MSQRTFSIIVVLLLASGSWILYRQRAAIAEVKHAAQTKADIPTLDQTSPSRQRIEKNTTSPSSELLKLRGEVTVLRRELNELQTNSLSEHKVNPDTLRDEWALVHSGPKPSELPGFFLLSQITNAGFATPQAAFQSFQHIFRTAKRNLTPTEMKELWDVPDDFDDPNGGYSINLGHGHGAEIGCRIVSEEHLSSSVVRLTVDFERPDGSSFRREHTMVLNNGRWRMQPAGLSRK